MSRYIDIEPYEKDGWYLQKRYHNSYGEAIKTTPLVSVPTADAELTFEQVEEYCRKRCLVVVDGALFNEMKSRWSAEPVKHGRWVWKDHYLVCSECGEENDRKNYCPNCGAKMDEVEE